MMFFFRRSHSFEKADTRTSAEGHCTIALKEHVLRLISNHEPPASWKLRKKKSFKTICQDDQKPSTEVGSPLTDFEPILEETRTWQSLKISNSEFSRNVSHSVR
jgi:hypothetical protein